MKSSEHWLTQEKVSAECEKMLEEFPNPLPQLVQAKEISRRLGVPNGNGNVYKLVAKWKIAKCNGNPLPQLPDFVIDRLKEQVELFGREVVYALREAIRESLAAHEAQAAARLQHADNRAAEAEQVMDETITELGEREQRLNEAEAELEKVSEQLETARATIAHLNGRIDQLERIQRIARDEPATAERQAMVDALASTLPAQRTAADASPADALKGGHHSMQSDGSDAE
jgi:hypothetical protein